MRFAGMAATNELRTRERPTCWRRPTCGAAEFLDAEVLVQALAGSYFARLWVSGFVQTGWAQDTVDKLARHWPGLSPTL